jgi:hypothetical protein
VVVLQSVPKGLLQAAPQWVDSRNGKWPYFTCQNQSIIAGLYLVIRDFGLRAIARARWARKGVQYLEQTRDGVVAAVKGLSGAQMKFKPAPDRWSVAEILEHIALAENDAHNLFAQANEIDRGRRCRPQVEAALPGHPSALYQGHPIASSITIFTI